MELLKDNLFPSFKKFSRMVELLFSGVLKKMTGAFVLIFNKKVTLN